MQIFKHKKNDNTKTVKPGVGDRTDMIGTKDIRGLLLNFSIPAIVGMLANASYNVINRIFVGHAVGPDAIGAITVTFPILIIFMGLSMLIGVGATTLISIRLGQQKSNEAEAIMGNALSLLILLPLICCIGMYFYIEPLLIFFGSLDSLLPYAIDYLKILMPGMILMSVSMGMNNIIRAEGNPITAMLTQILGGAVNVAFNFIFVMILDWGVQGAALGAVLGQVFAVTWVMFYFFSRNRSFLKIRARNLIPRLSYIGSISVIGFAPFMMQITASIQMLILNRTLGEYGGEIALAVVGIVGSLSQLIVMPIVGLSQGAQPIIGYNHGAHQYDRVRETLKKAVIYATVFSIFAWIIIRLFPIQMVDIFTDNEPAVTAMASHALVIFFLMMIIVGFQVICSGYFQAIGKPVQATILSLTRQVLFFIPLLIILPRFMGLEGVWWSAPVSDLAAVLITGACIILELYRTGMLRAKDAKEKTEAFRIAGRPDPESPEPLLGQ